MQATVSAGIVAGKVNLLFVYFSWLSFVHMLLWKWKKSFCNRRTSFLKNFGDEARRLSEHFWVIETFVRTCLSQRSIESKIVCTFKCRSNSFFFFSWHTSKNVPIKFVRTFLNRSKSLVSNILNSEEQFCSSKATLLSKCLGVKAKLPYTCLTKEDF